MTDSRIWQVNCGEIVAVFGNSGGIASTGDDVGAVIGGIESEFAEKAGVTWIGWLGCGWAVDIDRAVHGGEGNVDEEGIVGAFRGEVFVDEVDAGVADAVGEVVFV